MKPGLLLLPFLAIFIAAVGTAAGSAITAFKWIAEIAWLLAASVIGLWVLLDRQNFQAMFRRKGAKYGASSGLVVILGMVAIIGVAVVTARPRFNKSYDLTRDRLNTLSDQTIKVIAAVKDSGEPVSITAFISDEKASTDLRDLINLYQSKGANFKVEYIDPQTDPTRAMAEKVNEANTVILKHKAQEKRISAFTEEKLTNALVNVLKDKVKTIYFIKGHGEGTISGTEPTSFGKLVKDLESDKNKVAEISLLETAKIPDDADLVVVGGPKYEFKEEETRILEDYLVRGGAVFVMVNGLAPVNVISQFTEKFGVNIGNDFLILAPNDVRAKMIGQNSTIVTDFDGLSPITRDFSKQSQVAIVMRNARSLKEIADNHNKLKVELVAKTLPEMLRIKDVKEQKDLENITESRWEQGSFPVLAVAVGKSQFPATAEAAQDPKSDKADVGKDAGTPKAKEMRLVVAGSSDFASNQGAQLAENRDLFMNVVNFLMQDEDFISIRPKDPTKSTLTINTWQSQLTLLLLSFIYPFVFLGIGSFVWLRRRRA